MKKRHLNIVSCLLLLLTACSEPTGNTPEDYLNASTIETITANSIIERSINFHDPKDNWNKLNATFSFESSFSWNDSIPEELNISIDVPKNEFRYVNLDRKVDIFYPKDSCIVNSKDGSCAGYSWTKNFYTYVWGLPMKLKDPGIKPEEDFVKMTLRGKEVYEVKVNYDAENFKFYFDSKTFQLEFFSFLKNDTSGHGEFIILKDLYEFNGIKFPAHKTWTNLSDTSLIGTNVVTTITAKE